MTKMNGNATTKALFKNTGIIAIGQISTKIVNFLLLPLYTALLTKEEYGLVDVLSTYSGFIVVIISMQMTQAAFRFLVTCREDETEKKCVISTIGFYSLVALAIYTLVFIIIHPLISLSYKWFLLIHVCSTMLLQLCSNISRGLGKNADYATGNFISAATAIALNVITIAWLRLGVRAMLASYIIGHIFGSIYIIFRSHIAHYIDLKKATREKFKVIIQYSLPLVPNEISWSVIHASDRLVVQHFMNLAANGLIAVASKFSVIYTTAFSIFNTAWTEQVVLHYNDVGGKEYISDMFNKMVTFFASIAIGIISCMPFLFGVFVNDSFSESYGLVPWYMIAVFFNVIIGMISAVYLINNETTKIAISTMIAAAINLIVDIALINYIGAYAAPVSSICGYATISILRLVDVNRRYCHISIKLNRVLILMCGLTVALISYYSELLYIHIINLLIFLVGAICLNKSFFHEIYELVFPAKKTQI